MAPSSRLVSRTVLACALGLVGLATAPASAAPPGERSAPLVDVIVTLEPSADPAAASGSLVGSAGEVTHVYRSVLNGFAASMPETLLPVLRGDARVERVEIDRGMHASGTQSPTPSWGLDRIDQRNLPLDDAYTYRRTGAKVRAYIVDTGILTTHPAFAGRARHGADIVDNDGKATDCNGHGTHVAGTVGGSKYGVARSATLVAVRVLDCNGSGSTADVIAGLEWVADHHQPGQPAVANLSLGGGASAALDDALRRVVADGVTVAVAAGNENTDACATSPARTPEALTVAASDRKDARASFSNRGTCVDLFAPGVGITSAWLGDGSRTISGTSMASPHVAGAAALYLAGRPGASPSTVSAAILRATTKNKISNTARTCVLVVLCQPATPRNHLLYTGR